MIKKYYHGIDRVKQILFVICYLSAKLLVEKSKIKLFKTIVKGVNDGIAIKIKPYDKVYNNIS